MSRRKDVAYEDNGVPRKVGKAHYIYLYGIYFLNFWNDFVKTFLTSTELTMKKVS